MNESVKKLLKESMWDLATCANGEPNVVPVAFKDVTPDGKLVVGDVFLDTTQNMSPRARSSRPLRPWSSRCSTAEPLPRAHSSSPRRRSSSPRPAQTTRKNCKTS